MSNELIHNVDQVFIDEEGKYDLNIDHVIISIKIIDSKGRNKNKTPKINHRRLGTVILTKINGNCQCFYLLLLFSQEHYKSTNESDSNEIVNHYTKIVFAAH